MAAENCTSCRKSIRTHRHIMIWSRRIFCEAIFCRYWTCTFSCRNNQAIGPRLSAFSPSFYIPNGNGNKKNAATLIRELRLVAPPRLELSQTEPKSGVLPLHHGANLFARCMVANQSRAITPWGNRFFCVFAGAKIRDYSDISKFFGKNLSHLHAVCVEMLCVLLKIAWLTMCFDDVDDIVANLLATIDDVHIHHA